MNDIKTRLEKCFALALPNLAKEEISRASLSSVAGWDSLATVNILSLIEEEFGVHVAEEDMQEFVSFELILDYVRATADGARA